METNANYTMIGMFVITLTCAIIFSVVWLSSGLQSEDDFIKYKIQMKESVSGLNPEAPVEYNGVNVGKVTNIKINKENVQLVSLLISIDKETPITIGTRAKLNVRTISGVGYIELIDKGNDMRPLVATAGNEYPIIETTPSLFLRLDTALTQLNDNFRDFSKSVRSFLNDENLKSIKNILHSGSNTLNLIQTETIPNLNQTFSNMDELTNNLTDVSTEIKENPSIMIRGKESSQELGPGEK